jgi:hypothetical protein
MNERLLHFIWQFQYYNKTDLILSSGDELQVITPGSVNTNQGPDFLNARIRIAGAMWAGSVEIHVSTSDWEKHMHDQDDHYRNVILHVVWDHDKKVNDIPVLELNGRVARHLLQRYMRWMESSFFIPCENEIAFVDDIVWKSAKDRLLAVRLMRKSALIEALLEANNFHWEEIFWWMLARNFGMKVNAECFEAVARSLSIAILARHRQQPHQLEALLFGQAGLLENVFTEAYPGMLQKEYRYHAQKYGLERVHQLPLFLRMRPQNFPTIRLAQLAMLIHGSSHLFSRIRDADSLKQVKQWLTVTANDYWHYHYRFDEPCAFSRKTVGSTMADHIIINTIAPMLFAWGNYYGNQVFNRKAVSWLEETAAEKNHVTEGFSRSGIFSRSAFDTQALNELKTEYCDKRRCLECVIGNYLLKKETVENRQ